MRPTMSTVSMAVSVPGWPAAFALTFSTRAPDDSSRRKVLAHAVEAFEHEVFVELERNGQPRRHGPGGAAREQAHEIGCLAQFDSVQALDRTGLRVLAAARDRIDRLRRIV